MNIQTYVLMYITTYMFLYLCIYKRMQMKVDVHTCVRRYIFT